MRSHGGVRVTEGVGIGRTKSLPILTILGIG